MRISFKHLVTVFMCLVCLSVIIGPASADYKNFGIYQDTNGDGILNPGDTFIKGFMTWYTWHSAASSYNYNEHSDPYLSGQTDLPGAPWASDSKTDGTFSWLPMHEDELHIYMVWSEYGNTVIPGESGSGDKPGFSLGMIANNYIREDNTVTASGGYDLDIAIRNDGTTLPQVTLSDDYTNGAGVTTGRPPAPGTLDLTAQEQELYKTTGTDATYNHQFEGRWDYTATHSTADGGVISGIHNGDYDIEIDPSNIVTSRLGDGLVIRIDPQAFDEVDKIVFYDFGYFNGAQDTLGSTAPVGYVGSDVGWGPLGIEIPIGTSADKTFFIAAIPEVVPEPVTLLSLAIMAVATALVTGKRHNRV